MMYHLELVRHFFCAHSRHGTHSPFVYDLADHVIYSNRINTTQHEVVIDCDWDATPKYIRLVIEILSYLGSFSLSDFRKDGSYWVNLKKDNIFELIKRVESGQLLVVHEPHLEFEKWSELINNEIVIVSIDLFHFGLVLNRNEQRKENFNLRFPYWRMRR